jgi:hypothetical protein
MLIYQKICGILIFSNGSQLNTRYLPVVSGSLSKSSITDAPYVIETMLCLSETPLSERILKSLTQSGVSTGASEEKVTGIE